MQAPTGVQLQPAGCNCSAHRDTHGPNCWAGSCVCELHGSFTRICLLELSIKCLLPLWLAKLHPACPCSAAGGQAWWVNVVTRSLWSGFPPCKRQDGERSENSMSSNFLGILCVLHCCQVKDSVTPCHKIQQDTFTMDAFTMDACCN